MFAHGHVIVCPCVGLRRVVFKADGKDGESFPGTLHVAAPQCARDVWVCCVCVLYILVLVLDAVVCTIVQWNLSMVVTV